MTEIFPGAPGPVVALAGAMEATKLVPTGWLARYWPSTGGMMRAVLIALIGGLTDINAASVCGRLGEAHIVPQTASSLSPLRLCCRHRS